MSNKDRKQVYDIPEEGSLGLLALGDVGLKAWREKIKKTKDNRVEDHKENKKGDE